MTAEKIIDANDLAKLGAAVVMNGGSNGIATRVQVFEPYYLEDYPTVAEVSGQYSDRFDNERYYAGDTAA